VEGTIEDRCAEKKDKIWSKEAVFKLYRKTDNRPNITYIIPHMTLTRRYDKL
jgi:hypothetical protein